MQEKQKNMKRYYLPNAICRPYLDLIQTNQQEKKDIYDMVKEI